MHSLKLLTIVVEPVLEDLLVDLVLSEGVTGYSLVEVRSRAAKDLSGTNIKLEMILSQNLAEKILERVQLDFFEHYSIIVYLQEVEVIRSHKFLNNSR